MKQWGRWKRKVTNLSLRVSKSHKLCGNVNCRKVLVGAFKIAVTDAGEVPLCLNCYKLALQGKYSDKSLRS